MFPSTPTFYLANYAWVGASIKNRNLTPAVIELQKARSIEDKPWIIGTLGYAYAASGDTVRARAVLKELSQLAEHRQLSTFWLAMIHMALREGIKHSSSSIAVMKRVVRGWIG